ncbi:uncharacterized protein LOC134192849 [Corticium candelabrum]|uniref:uncharacterized protein LOC134192849 n=1 Tax=Corticium candelabrum TaxID=121492 RepID=UPI002E27057E|nr:uncharacterized protein LOC134192849 [Corticium candelabrum]
MATSASCIANESVLTTTFAKSSATLGIASLHSEQRTTLKYLLNERDAFATFPTGFETPAIFQVLPSVMHELRTAGVNLSAKHPIVLVLSPPRSLMGDQVTGLPSKGLSAAIIGASCECDSRIKQGCYFFVYGSPEAIVGSDE